MFLMACSLIIRKEGIGFACVMRFLGDSRVTVHFTVDIQLMLFLRFFSYRTGFLLVLTEHFKDGVRCFIRHASSVFEHAISVFM
jgi:hypothetical protein